VARYFFHRADKTTEQLVDLQIVACRLVGPGRKKPSADKEYAALDRIMHLPRVSTLSPPIDADRTRRDQGRAVKGLVLWHHLVFVGVTLVRPRDTTDNDAFAILLKNYTAPQE
jgi:hypothetical protein